MTSNFQYEDLHVFSLNVTKFIHLCFGDGGIQRLFSAIYRLLRPGGRLILQFQVW